MYYICRNLHPTTSLKNMLFQKLFWPLFVWVNRSRDLKTFADSRPSDFWTIEQYFFTVGQNNFWNKMSEVFKVNPFLIKSISLFRKKYMVTALDFWFCTFLKNTKKVQMLKIWPKNRKIRKHLVESVENCTQTQA